LRRLSRQADQSQQGQQQERQQQAQGEREYRQRMQNRQEEQAANRPTRQTDRQPRLDGWTYDDGEWDAEAGQRQAGQRQRDDESAQQRRQSQQATRQQRDTAGDGNRQQMDDESAQQRRQSQQATRQQRDTAGDGNRQQMDDQSEQARGVLLVQPVTIDNDAEDIDDSGIQDVIYSTTKAALVADFDDVVERFLDADRNRLGQTDLDELAGMERAGDRVTRIWQRKFGSRDIDIDEHDALSGVAIFQGEIGSSPQLTTAVLRNSGNFGLQDSGVGNEPGDFNMEEGREIAVAILPAAQNVGEVQIPLILEFPDRWKINVPDNLSASRLHSNLVQHLNHLADNEANWPATEDEAFRYVAQHVMMGVLGQPVPR
jgi:hypothetical protein